MPAVWAGILLLGACLSHCGNDDVTSLLNARDLSDFKDRIDSIRMRAVARTSMQNGELARSTQRLIQMLRPEKVGTAAQTAMTWFKPRPISSGVITPIRRFPSFPATLGRLGALEVRLAQQKHDVKRAQKLRYRVFYKDGTAIADAATMLARRDKDAFDRICDHLLVIDHAAKPSIGGKQPVVGTYRLLRQEVAANHGGFYTEDEFDISGLTH